MCVELWLLYPTSFVNVAVLSQQQQTCFLLSHAEQRAVWEACATWQKWSAQAPHTRIGYTLWLFNSLPWKITIFNR
jgi:hypothetical protein